MGAKSSSSSHTVNPRINKSDTTKGNFEQIKYKWIDIENIIITLENSKRKTRPANLDQSIIKRITSILAAKPWPTAVGIYKCILPNSADYATRFRFAYELNNFILFTDQKELENIVIGHLCAVILMFEKLSAELEDYQSFHHYLAMLGTSHWLSRVNIPEYRIIMSGFLLYLTENHPDVMNEEALYTMAKYYFYITQEMLKFRHRLQSQDSGSSIIQPRNTGKVMQGWTNLRQELLDRVKVEQNRERNIGMSHETLSGTTIQSSWINNHCSFLCWRGKAQNHENDEN